MSPGGGIEWKVGPRFVPFAFSLLRFSGAPAGYCVARPTLAMFNCCSTSKTLTTFWKSTSSAPFTTNLGSGSAALTASSFSLILSSGTDSSLRNTWPCSLTSMRLIFGLGAAGS